MIFLIQYDRPAGRLVTFKRYDESLRVQAQDDRLALELELLRKGIEHEVVLLEADSEETIRRSHARYFKTLKEIVEDFQRAVLER